MKVTTHKKATEKTIIKKCHMCGQLTESYKEISKCPKCTKSFLPLNYFGKVHAKNSKEFGELYCVADELQDEDLIKGLTVLWL